MTDEQALAVDRVLRALEASLDRLERAIPKPPATFPTVRERLAELEGPPAPGLSSSLAVSPSGS